MKSNLIDTFKSECGFIDEKIKIDNSCDAFVFRDFCPIHVCDGLEEMKKYEDEYILGEIVKMLSGIILRDYGVNLAETTRKTFEEKISDLLGKDFIVCSKYIKNWPGIKDETLKTRFYEKIDETPKLEKFVDNFTVPFININSKFKFNFDYDVNIFEPTDYDLEYYIEDYKDGQKYIFEGKSYDDRGSLKKFLKQSCYFYQVTCKYKVSSNKGDLVYNYKFSLSRYSLRLFNLIRKCFDACINSIGPFKKRRKNKAGDGLREYLSSYHFEQDFVKTLNLDEKEVLLAYYFYGSSIERKKEEDFYSFLKEAENRMKGEEFVEFADADFEKKLFSLNFVINIMLGLYRKRDRSIFDYLLYYLKNGTEAQKTYFDEIESIMESIDG